MNGKVQGTIICSVIAASLAERIHSSACDKSSSKTLKFYRKNLKKRTAIAKLR